MIYCFYDVLRMSYPCWNKWEEKRKRDNFEQSLFRMRWSPHFFEHAFGLYNDLLWLVDIQNGSLLFSNESGTNPSTTDGWEVYLTKTVNPNQESGIEEYATAGAGFDCTTMPLE